MYNKTLLENHKYSLLKIFYQMFYMNVVVFGGLKKRKSIQVQMILQPTKKTLTSLKPHLCRFDHYTYKNTKTYFSDRIYCNYTNHLLKNTRETKNLNYTFFMKEKRNPKIITTSTKTI